MRLPHSPRVHPALEAAMSVGYFIHAIARSVPAGGAALDHLRKYNIQDCHISNAIVMLQGWPLVVQAVPNALRTDAVAHIVVFFFT
jgi:hypothetical protein